MSASTAALSISRDIDLLEETFAIGALVNAVHNDGEFWQDLEYCFNHGLKSIKWALLTAAKLVIQWNEMPPYDEIEL
ncbi:unnamed protein product [Clonostachys rosea f. rosea IK726]|uniref:Uncharacterized protein n=1 Tax=Clonostachys rosea f. rosea IK726 TaxID=1349383 RepID=A0ACA9TW23_BIOOC|nr:unnamed protein product [Clonostachys rosea f. rosea IK726]